MEKNSLNHWIMRLTALLIVLLCISSVCFGQANRLKKIEDMALLSTHTFAEVQGSLGKVDINSEESNYLELEVEVIGYQGAYLTTMLLGPDRKAIRQIPAKRLKIDHSASLLQIRFEVEGDVSPNGNLRSRYLQLVFSQQQGRFTPNSPAYLFEYHKIWGGNNTAAPVLATNEQLKVGTTSNHAPQNTSPTVIGVRLQAVGSATALGKGSLPIPARKIKSAEDHMLMADTAAADSTSTAIDNRPRGPGKQQISLWGQLRADVELELDEISALSFTLFQDQNPNSQVFYYFPQGFYTAYEPEDGFALNQLYGTSAGEGKEGAVRIHAKLQSGQKTRDIAILKQLLLATHQRDAILKPLPLNTTPRVSLASHLNQLYSIESSQVSTTAYTDLSQPLSLNWTTDSRTRDEMAVALSEGAGLSGSIEIQPEGDSLTAISLPLRINPYEEKAYGKLMVNPKTWRNERWSHHLPLPIRLHYLHVLMIKEGNDQEASAAYVYSYDLDKARVAPGQEVVFDHRQLPVWIDSSPYNHQMWIEYSLERCAPCMQEILDKSLGGTSSSSRQMIRFESFDALQISGARSILIKSRSRQADTKGKEVRYLPEINLQEDRGFETGPVFIPPAELPDVEYQLSLVMPDGSILRSERWFKAQEKEIFLGSKTLEEAFPNLPKP